MGRSFFDRRLHERGMSYEETAPVRRLRATPVRSLAASLDDIEDRIETARAQLGAIRAGRARAPKLDARTPAMEARRELDRGGNAVVEVDLGVGETEDPRRFVHIAALDEFAWRLMLADSEAGILGPLQARDFVSLFESDLARELDPRELELLEAFGRLRVARAGEPLLRQGESSRNFFIVNAGVVRVRHREGDDGRTVAWLRSGAVFGEVSFLTGAPRSADVEASTDCIVQEFRPEFVGLAHHGSEMHRALSKLARRRGVRLRTDPPPAER